MTAAGSGVEALLCSAYALFLLGVAGGLELVARHTHRRADRHRVAGFRYHAHLDAWQCPQGQHLWPVGVDAGRRVARWRAQAHVCNRCPVKAACTDADDGREVVRSLDPWPHSEVGRFHRGLSLALVVLAGLVTAIGLVRNPRPGPLLLLGAVGLVVAATGGRLLAALRASPAGFPDARS